MKGGAHLRRFLILILCCLLLAVPCMAATVDAGCVVEAGGDCEMTVVITLNAGGATELVFPLGGGATNGTINGVECAIRTVNGVNAMVLESASGFNGNQTFQLRYTLKDRLSDAGVLQLPILAGGFAYSIESLNFTITLPQEFDQKPTFSSGYYGTDIDNYLSVTVEGATITGRSLQSLKDHETLTMRLEGLPVDAGLSLGGSLESIAGVLSMVLLLGALAYWFFALRSDRLRIDSTPTPPMGITAGEMVCRVTGGNPDLALMILSWAELGYVTLHLTRDSNVTIHKTMGMGNERSRFERKIFTALFRKGDMVQAASRRFQHLRQQVESHPAPSRGQFLRSSGNPVLPVLMGTLGTFFAGVRMALGMAGGFGGFFLSLILGVGCGALAWVVMDACHQVLSFRRGRILWGVGALAAVLVLGLLTGNVMLALVLAVLLIAIGVATMFGGRRSLTGQMELQNILGLRKFLQNVSKKRLWAAQSRNTAYYYQMAPYAQALGVDQDFARRFGGHSLVSCPWLATTDGRRRNAEQWCNLLRQTAVILRGETAAPTKPAPRRHPGSRRT